VGGSSGGSAAAVAAGLTGLDLGSDLGGSIRNPAGYCGVFGLRPSHGIIPTRGHLPGPPGSLAEVDLATVGPLARSAPTSDWRWTSWPARTRRRRSPGDSICPLRVPTRCADTGSLPGWTTTSAPSTRRCSGSSARSWTRWPPPGQQSMPPPGRARCGRPSVSRSNSSRPSSRAHTPEPEYKRLQHVAATADPADDSAPVRHVRNVTARARDLGVAREARARLSARCAAFFIDYDVLLCPITPTTAIPHDHQPDVDARRIIVNGRPRPYGDQIPWASLAGLCGLPAVVLPAGLARGLPVGLQIIGPRLEDRTAVDVAARIAMQTGGYVPPPGY
jgi:amidase